MYDEQIAEIPVPHQRQLWHDYVDFDTWRKQWPEAFRQYASVARDPLALVTLRNPLARPQSFKIALGWPERLLGSEPKVRARFDQRNLAVRVTIPPGEELRVPVEWARVTHTQSRGVVVGGLAPMLEILDDDGRIVTPERHPALSGDASGRPRVNGGRLRIGGVL